MVIYYLCVIILLTGIRTIDSARVRQQKEPVFTYQEVILDEGMRVYLGVGYIVYRYDQPELEGPYFELSSWLQPEVRWALIIVVALPIVVLLLRVFHKKGGWKALSGITKAVTIYYLCVLAALFAMRTSDHYRAIRQQDPIFAVSKNMIWDGGTWYYYGIGYTVVHYNQLEGNGGRTDIEFQSGSASWEEYDAIVLWVLAWVVLSPVVFLSFRKLLKTVNNAGNCDQ